MNAHKPDTSCLVILVCCFMVYDMRRIRYRLRKIFMAKECTPATHFVLTVHNIYFIF